MTAKLLAPLLLLLGAGLWFGGVRHGLTSALAVKPAHPVLYYQSPMHPWVRSARPGRCTVCGMELVPVYETTPASASPSGLVLLPAGSPALAGLHTAPVRKEPLPRVVRVSGQIGEDETRHGVICAPVEGRLDGLAMSCEGQQVTLRQPFGTIFSRTLLGLAAEYRAALDHDEAIAAQACRRLEQCGLVAEQIKAIPQRQKNDLYFGVLSPRTGTIVKSYVAEGQYVREGERLFEIADFTTMWFTGSVAESDLPFLALGQVVEIQVPSLPGPPLKARLSFISPAFDEATRTARVRATLENPERRLKNKSAATGTVETEAPVVLSVPRPAVLWPGQTPRVWVEKSLGRYEPRQVQLGRAGDEAWEVLAGLAEGEQVVTAGAILLEGQARLTQEP